MDRIDLHVDVPRPSAAQVLGQQSGLSTKEMRELVLDGIAFRQDRLTTTVKQKVACKTDAQLDDFKSFSAEARHALEAFSDSYSLGGRAIARTISLARTIADIDQRACVNGDDVIEAVAYRMRDAT